MIVSAKGRYALRVMVALAKSDGRIVPLKEIASSEAIPHKFLENIMTELSKAGLVEGSRGKNGGYRLTRPPENYTVAQILNVTELSFAQTGCSHAGTNGSCAEKDESGCPRARVCPTLPMWQAFDQTVNEFFSRYTLASLIK